MPYNAVSHYRGLDFKITIPNHRYNWTNAEFDVVRLSDPSYATMEESWVRQSNWGLDIPLQHLGDHPLGSCYTRTSSDLIPTFPFTSFVVYVIVSVIARICLIRASVVYTNDFARASVCVQQCIRECWSVLRALLNSC